MAFLPQRALDKRKSFSLEFIPPGAFPVLLFSLIILGNLLVYSPAFYHVPRADHMFYLADMAGKNDWMSLAIRSFDFSRSRSFAPGDGLIFRPGAMFLLGTEKAWFGYDFFWWQMTGLLFHLLVAACLYRLLFFIHPGIWAFWITAFFSLMFMNYELVSWHHITSVMLSLSLLLASLYQWVRYTSSEKKALWRIGLMTLCMTLACFTYEINCFYSVCLFMFLLAGNLKHKRRLWHAFPVLLAPAFYALASYINHQALGQQAVDYNVFWSGNSFADKIYFMLKAILWWIYAGIFPGVFSVVHTLGRAGIENPQQLFKPLDFMNIPVLLGLAAAGAYAFFFCRSCSLRFLKKRGMLAGLILSLIISWTFAIVIYRVQNRGVDFALGGTLYYLYTFWLFFCIMLYALIDFKALRNIRFIKIGRWVTGGLLVALMAVNGSLVYRMNRHLRQQHEPARRLIIALESLIEEYGQEPGFSFFVHPDFPGNFLYPYSLRREDPPYKLYSFIELLYLDYYDNQTPRYVFTPDQRNQGQPVVFRTKW